MSTDDKRLLEDYLPIVDVSFEAAREKSVRKGHISTVHLWWARRPLVAVRAAVYAALVPARRFQPAGANEKRVSLGRANAAKFVKALCLYPAPHTAVAEAQRHILEAHADRLSTQTGKAVSVADIVSGKAPRPKVLDMFAGGGSIPLEAARLGCDSFALDLNPVAHFVQLCSLVFPQKYGRPNPHVLGMTGPKNAEGHTSWGGLAKEVQYWGEWVLKNAKNDIGDLYPYIPDPQTKSQGKGNEKKSTPQQTMEFANSAEGNSVPAGFLLPVAYLWTRTVTCKNPRCRATVPLLRQTWLCKKPSRYVALKVSAPKGKKDVRFEVVTARSDRELGFDPSEFSKGGNATCPFCGTVCDIDYVKSQGWAGNLGYRMMAAACVDPKDSRGKVYVSADDVEDLIPSIDSLKKRIATICEASGISVPDEPIAGLPGDSAQNSLGITVRPYGIRTFSDLLHPRQLACLLGFANSIRKVEAEIKNLDSEHRSAILAMLACFHDRLADFSSTACVWNCLEGERTAHTFGRHAISMTWDFAEVDPFNPANAGWPVALERIIPAIESIDFQNAATVVRGTATNLPWPDASFDAVITDPPYYDNVPYADISDFFYVWLKRTVGHIFPTDLAGALTPKKSEAIADAGRHGGSWDRAKRAYEEMMGNAFKESHRILKPDGIMAVVYAHKTTLGWSTLVDALRNACFTVTEAWPLDTEKPGRLRAQSSAALASSIFLVARKRSASAKVGNYESDVLPDLLDVVAERVDTLWEMGISGADLVIACIGAGLRAFTKYERVEYGNGEEVPSERFLTEVETVVLDAILKKLSKAVGANGGRYSLAGLDAATRFYTLWRFTYKSAELEAGEAIIFANGTHVELDGLHGLSSGSNALVGKKKGKYRLLDYSERGDDAKLGLPLEDATSAPLIDALHRLLWLMERHPSGIPDFLHDARPNVEQLRLVAQALAGPALKGSELSEVTTGSELAALTKLTANWRSVVDGAAEGEGPLFRAVRGRE